jgi:hypothetical protein
MMRTTLVPRRNVIFLALLFLGNTTHLRAGLVYDLGKDFSATNNPNGVWSYGYQATLGGSLTLFTLHGALTSDQGNPIDEWYKTDLETAPLVQHNGNAKPQTLESDAYDPGQFTAVPGPNDYTVARWKAATGGQFRVQVLFEGMQFPPGCPVGTTTDVHVLKNTVSLFDGTVSGWAGRPYVSAPRFGSSPDQSFSAVLTVAAGDTIDFIVGNGGNGFYCDGTGISAQISSIPEPSSLTMA